MLTVDTDYMYCISYGEILSFPLLVFLFTELCGVTHRNAALYREILNDESKSFIHNQRKSSVGLLLKHLLFFVQYIYVDFL